MDNGPRIQDINFQIPENLFIQMENDSKVQNYEKVNKLISLMLLGLDKKNHIIDNPIIKSLDQNNWKFISLCDQGYHDKKIPFSTVQKIISVLSKEGKLIRSENSNNLVIHCKDGEVEFNKQQLFYANSFFKALFEGDFKKIELKDDKKYHLSNEMWKSYSKRSLNLFYSFITNQIKDKIFDSLDVFQILEVIKLADNLNEKQLFDLGYDQLKIFINKINSSEEIDRVIIELNSSAFINEDKLHSFQVKLLTNWLSKNDIYCEISDNYKIALDINQLQILENAPDPINKLLSSYHRALILTKPSDNLLLRFFAEFQSELLKEIETLLINDDSNLKDNISDISLLLPNLKHICFQMKFSAQYHHIHLESFLKKISLITPNIISNTIETYLDIYSPHVSSIYFECSTDLKMPVKDINFRQNVKGISKNLEVLAIHPTNLKENMFFNVSEIKTYLDQNYNFKIESTGEVKSISRKNPIPYDIYIPRDIKEFHY